MNLSSPAHSAHAAAYALHFAASLPCSPLRRPIRPIPHDRAHHWPASQQPLHCPTHVSWDDLALEALPVEELASC